jgi:hypothetical protein
MKATYSDFVNKLKKLYGSFDEEHKKFEKAPNSEIARELGYSDAQFSRLINESATEGEYTRANQNAERILILIDYKEKFAKINVDPHNALASPRRKIIFFLLGLIFGAICTYLAIDLFREIPKTNSKYDMLEWTFESNFINPYKGIRDLPASCDYECYKYQGKWELKNEYKLPFLRESSGFHYSAKSVVAYVSCNPNDNIDGKLMKGYEYQEHEIWYDILERPISTFINDDGRPLASYDTLHFDKDADFIKIGTIHSFYTNDFSLDSTGINRSGQDIGRDLEFVPEDMLARQVNNKSLVEKIKREITLIIQDPLRDFSKPSSCGQAEKPRVDFHDIANGDEMAFNCQMTTAGRFKIKYSKTYILKDQFIKDNCRSEKVGE